MSQNCMKQSIASHQKIKFDSGEKNSEPFFINEPLQNQFNQTQKDSKFGYFPSTGSKCNIVKVYFCDIQHILEQLAKRDGSGETLVQHNCIENSEKRGENMRTLNERLVNYVSGNEALEPNNIKFHKSISHQDSCTEHQQSKESNENFFVFKNIQEKQLPSHYYCNPCAMNVMFRSEGI